ncbi:hypothetical protein [Streptomyces phaeoluteigriseus]
MLVPRRGRAAARAVSAVAGLTLLGGVVPAVTGMAVAAPRAHQEVTQGATPANDTESAAFGQAARSKKKVEITSLRGETSETYALPNGNFEAVQHLRPVRARVDGGWQAIDTALHKRADGSIAPKAATVGIAFSGGGKKTAADHAGAGGPEAVPVLADGAAGAGDRR